MRKIHHLLGLLSLFLVGGSTIAMIKGTTMPELYVSLLGMISGGIIFLIYAKIDNEIKNR